MSFKDISNKEILECMNFLELYSDVQLEGIKNELIKRKINNIENISKIDLEINRRNFPIANPSNDIIDNEENGNKWLYRISFFTICTLAIFHVNSYFPKYSLELSLRAIYFFCIICVIIFIPAIIKYDLFEKNRYLSKSIIVFLKKSGTMFLIILYLLIIYTYLINMIHHVFLGGVLKYDGNSYIVVNHGNYSEISEEKYKEYMWWKLKAYSSILILITLFSLNEYKVKNDGST